jgi:hypothetical protein
MGLIEKSHVKVHNDLGQKYSLKQGDKEALTGSNEQEVTSAAVSGPS